MDIKPPTGVNLPPPPLPGVGAPQPTQAERDAIEQTWAALRDAPVALAELILVINDHPELVDWARSSIRKTMSMK